jgi:FMN phosphatase YigB (HAD superfamily)
MPPSKPVILIDVDNTLLDNDTLRLHIDRGLEAVLGADEARRFWDVYERVRAEDGAVDVPRTAAQLALELARPDVESRVEAVLDGLPFVECLYPHALEAVAHLGTLGTTVILSDGEQLYQRHKIRASGIEAAVEGRVLVYVHKELEVDEVRARFDASRYVILDDKPGILAAMKSSMGATLTTCLVRQGKYAAAGFLADGPAPDVELASIAEALRLTAGDLEAASTP